MKYMGHIFEYCEDFETLRSQLWNEIDYPDADPATQMREAIINGKRGRCPRCEDESTALGENGTCVWCDYDLTSNRRPAA